MGQFNPYQHWLGITEASPNYYRLLGVAPFEKDSQKIATAAESQLARVRSASPGEQMAAWCALVSELAEAMKCLTDPASRAQYDAQLRGRLVGGGRGEPDDDEEFEELPPMALPRSGQWQQLAAAQRVAPSAASAPAAAPNFVATEARSIASRSQERAKRDRWRLAMIGGAVAATIAIVGAIVLSASSPDRTKLAAKTADAGPESEPVDVQQADDSQPAPSESQWAPIGPPPGQAMDASMVKDKPAAAKAKPSAAPSMAMPKGNGSGEEKPESEPKPDEPAEPAPAKAAMEISPEKAEAFRKALAAVREALASRQFALAKEKLDSARPLAETDAQIAQWEQAQRLDLYVNGFWDSVRDGLKQKQGGNEIQVGSTIAAIVETDPEYVILRVAGRNVRYAVPGRIPTPVALHFAEKWFDDRPDNKMFLGAFHAVDPRGDRQEAIRLWQEAQAAGIKADGLAALINELDVER